MTGSLPKDVMLVGGNMNKSITPPYRKGLEARLGRDGLVWAIDNKPLNLQVMPESSCSRFYVHCANKIGI